MMNALVESGKLGVMAVYENHGRHGKSDVVVSGGRVVRYDKGGGGGMEWVNFGVSALTRRALALIPTGKEFGEEEFYGELIRREELLAFPVRRAFLRDRDARVAERVRALHLWRGVRRSAVRRTT